MTREVRNIKLKYLITCMKCEVSGKVCDKNCPAQYAAGNMGEIIENLEAISEILEQQPCEDAVSRQAVLDELNCIGRNAFKDDTDYDNLFAFVDNLQPVNPKEKTGYWIQQPRCEGDKQPDLVCPNCGFKITWWDMGNFCAKCGTGLEGGAG